MIIRNRPPRVLIGRITTFTPFVQPPPADGITSNTDIPGLPDPLDTLAEITAQIEQLQQNQSVQTFERNAAIVLSGHRLVAYNASGNIVYADHVNEPDVIGISLNAAAIGQPVSIALNNTEVEHAGWSWTPQQGVFLGANGAIVQTPVANGYSVRVGEAITPTKIFLHIEHSIEL